MCMIATCSHFAILQEREVEMLFRKDGDIGIELDSNNKKGVQIVSKLTEGGQAEGWCSKYGYPPVALLGSEVAAVNGYRIPVGEEGAELCIDWMSTMRRPLSIAVKLRPGALSLARVASKAQLEDHGEASSEFTDQ